MRYCPFTIVYEGKGVVVRWIELHVNGVLVRVCEELRKAGNVITSVNRKRKTFPLTRKWSNRRRLAVAVGGVGDLPSRDVSDAEPSDPTFRTSCRSVGTETAWLRCACEGGEWGRLIWRNTSRTPRSGSGRVSHLSGERRRKGMSGLQGWCKCKRGSQLQWGSQFMLSFKRFIQLFQL